jgi:hypothetical protein
LNGLKLQFLPLHMQPCPSISVLTIKAFSTFSFEHCDLGIQSLLLVPQTHVFLSKGLSLQQWPLWTQQQSAGDLVSSFASTESDAG